MGPAKLVVSLIVGQHLVSYVISVVTQDKTSGGQNRTEVRLREIREVLLFNGNSAEWRNRVGRSWVPPDPVLRLFKPDDVFESISVRLRQHPTKVESVPK